METKDFIEKMIEDMSEAMKRLLKMDFNAEGEAFIHEFEQWAQHNVDFGEVDHMIPWQIDHLFYWRS